MSEAVDAARSGMIQHERNLETIATNLANLNTPGYKRVVGHFEDLLTTEAALDVLFGGESVAPATGARLDSVSRVFTAGPILASEVSTEMAVNGAGFFAVQQADGTTAYTRDGTFRRDAEGFLSTQNGQRLEPPIQVVGALEGFRVALNGRATGVQDGQTVELGQVQLAVFADPRGLISLGQNLFGESEASGAPQLLDPGTGDAGAIHGAAVEASNVRVELELTNLIAAQRAYQFNLVAFQTANDMLQQMNEATQL